MVQYCCDQSEYYYLGLYRVGSDFSLTSEGWQPIDPWLALTAIISFDAEGDGTRYASRVLHKKRRRR